MFGAYSLDDGATWKQKNLSNTGDLSSFTLRDGTPYPGDTFRLLAAAAGNKVMVARASRYCQGGNPGHTLSDEEIPFTAPLVRRECLSQHWFTTLEEARGILETWKEEYNNDRPHGSLQQMTPARYRAGVITAHDRNQPETRTPGGSEKG